MQTTMASGITVTSNPDPEDLQSLGVTSWPTWGCGVSTFPWSYDEQESCLLLEGDVTVTPDGGESSGRTLEYSLAACANDCRPRT